MGRCKGSSYDGNLAELQGWHVAAICQCETKQGYLSLLFYCVDDKGEWRKEGAFSIVGKREGILNAFAKVIYKQRSWKACEMKKGRDHCKPVDMGPDTEDVFVQIKGLVGFDSFNLKYWDGSVVYEKGNEKASIEMDGGKRFLTDSKKETIDRICQEALDLVKVRGEKKKGILEKYRKKDSSDVGIDKNELGPASNVAETDHVADRPVAPMQEVILSDSKPILDVIPFPVSPKGNILAADQVAEKRYGTEIEQEADTYISDEEMMEGHYHPKDCAKMSPEGQGSWRRRKKLELKIKAEDLYGLLLNKVES